MTMYGIQEKRAGGSSLGLFAADAAHGGTIPKSESGKYAA